MANDKTTAPESAICNRTARLLEIAGWHDAADYVRSESDYITGKVSDLMPPDLSDPVVVHANMLHGAIAKLTAEQIKHLYPDLAAAQAEIERLTKERDEARAQVAAALAHPPQPSVSVSCPAPTPDDETYYSKGKDANWLAELSDDDLAEAVCFAAQDLNDTGLGDDLDKWMPFQAMMSIAADRIKKLITAQPSVSDAKAALEAYGRNKPCPGKVRVQLRENRINGGGDDVG